MSTKSDPLKISTNEHRLHDFITQKGLYLYKKSTIVNFVLKWCNFPVFGQDLVVVKFEEALFDWEEAFSGLRRLVFKEFWVGVSKGDQLKNEHNQPFSLK